MPLVTTDPFTHCYQLVWSVLTGYAPWAATVTDGNRMRFDTVPYPPQIERNLQPGDTPLVALLQAEFPTDPYHFDTAAADMKLNFPLIVVGDTLKVDGNSLRVGINQVKWATLRALVNAGPYLGEPLLIRGVTMQGCRDDLLSPNEWKVGHKRAMAMCVIQVNATIKKANVLSGEYPTTL